MARAGFDVRSWRLVWGARALIAASVTVMSAWPVQVEAAARRGAQKPLTLRVSWRDAGTAAALWSDGRYVFAPQDLESGSGALIDDQTSKLRYVTAPHGCFPSGSAVGG
jgi:hypothetical protein